MERRQARRARTRDTRRVGLFWAPQWWTQAVLAKFFLASYDEYFPLVRRAETSWIARRVEHLEHVAVFLSVAPKLYPRNIHNKIATWW